MKTTYFRNTRLPAELRCKTRNPEPETRRFRIKGCMSITGGEGLYILPGKPEELLFIKGISTRSDEACQ